VLGFFLYRCRLHAKEHEILLDANTGSALIRGSFGANPTHNTRPLKNPEKPARAPGIVQHTTGFICGVPPPPTRICSSQELSHDPPQLYLPADSRPSPHLDSQQTRPPVRDPGRITYDKPLPGAGAEQQRPTPPPTFGFEREFRVGVFAGIERSQRGYCACPTREAV